MRMTDHYLVKPAFVPPLDSGFRPAVLANRKFRDDVRRSGGGVPMVIGLERGHGSVSRFETAVFAAGHPQATENFRYVERLLKLLLWQRGGWKVYLGGPQSIGNEIKNVYTPDGERAFDYHFLGETIYEKPFTVIVCDPAEVPPHQDGEQSLGRHLQGCRIGFDLGASDLKVSAVVDGEAIFSQETVWEPKIQSDPEYHYGMIMESLRLAASKMPRVDAIGGSSAGVYVDNRPMVASLYRGIPKVQFGRIKEMFYRIQKEMGVPLEVVNDGEVTALAGSMSIEDNGILGIALGSSEATGYVTLNGGITHWLNELAFAPVDYNPQAPVEEWSGDRGCGALYFSQQCVFRLAPQAGIEVPQGVTDAQKLVAVQEKLAADHPGALNIWRSMGYYMGYAIAHYADVYPIRHVLILGRCTSGKGGDIILNGAREVLQGEFTDLASNINVLLPDEKFRRVGQSIAAASLPQIN